MGALNSSRMEEFNMNSRTISGCWSSTCWARYSYNPMPEARDTLIWSPMPPFSICEVSSSPVIQAFGARGQRQCFFAVDGFIEYLVE